MKKTNKNILHFLSLSLIFISGILGIRSSTIFFEDIETPECLIR